MSVECTIADSTLRILYRSAQADSYSICPRLQLYFELSHTVRPGVSPQNITISNMSSEIRIISNGSWFYVGRLTLNELYWTISPTNRRTLNYYLDLDHYRLNQIEKIRKGGAVRFQVQFSIVTEAPIKDSFTFSPLEIVIPKSTWVEDILPNLKFKDVALLEVPKLINSEFTDVVNHINNAWKQYSMGEYDRVLTDSRKALEALITKIKNKGFETEINEEKGEKRKVPDWAKLIGNKELGDIVGIINQKIWGFVAPGSHTGKAINREDADFALMTTYALINLAIHKLT